MSRFREINEAEMYSSDHEVPASEHSKLLNSVSQLDSKQRVKPPSRKEPSLQVSEFHLVQSGEGRGNAVHLLDLAKVLKADNKQAQIGRKLKATRRKGRTLPKPLEKPLAEKIKRSVGFNKVKSQVARWEPLVQKNRVAEHLTFPLSQARISADTSKEFFARFKTQSPLEAQVAEILRQSKSAEEDKEDEEKEFPLSLEELIERRKEMARLRAQQSYEAAKARRQGKIKSKKYHRVLRREKVRRLLKDFETLQKTDPEAALEQLQQIERTRAEERMTLRHRNTGQWARSRAIRAKYDPQSRQELAEQLAISRDLTQRLKPGTDSSEEEEEEEVEIENTGGGIETKSDNPWINPEPEVQAFIGGYRKYWEKRNKEAAEKKRREPELTASDDVFPLNSSDPKKHLTEISHNSSSDEAMIESGAEEMCDEVKQLVVDESGKVGHNENKLKSVVSHPESLCIEKSCTKKTPSVENINKRPAFSNTSKHNPERSSVEVGSKGCIGKKYENKATVTGTSSWIVTPIKEANSKVVDKQAEKSIDKALSEDRENNNGKRKTKNVKIVDKWDQGKKRVLRENSDSKNVHVDDIFDDLEHKLKQKLSHKLTELKNNLKDNSNVNKNLGNRKEDDEIEGPSLEIRVKAKRPQEDLQLVEESGRAKQSVSPRVPVVPTVVRDKEPSTSKQDDVDPNKFMCVKPKLLQTQFPDVVTAGDEGLDNEAEEDQHMTITEAFTGDDVVADFAQEKADAAEKSKPKEIDLSLPGWGSWAGKNLPVRKRKKRAFIVKFPKPAPRRDDNKGHLIINEDKDTKVLQHQVSDVPFPFTTVKDFEASIRAPIGNTWVPETAYRKLIEPQVKTRLGAIIEPLDEETLVNKIKKARV